MEDPMELDEQIPINEPKTPKTSKRKQSKIDDDDVFVKEKNIKGILLSVRKPSYVLKRGIGIGRELRSLRSEHRKRLRCILRQLVRRQNWEEACGVLSLLLKGTYKESGVRSNRNKYWATLELLERMKAAKLEHKTVRKVYDIWMKKDGDGKNKRSLKGRLDVHLEFLLFHLSRSKTDDAIQTIISLKQDRDFSKDPIANLVVGLAYCHIWYKGISKEVCVRLHDDSHESSTSIQSGMSESQGMMSVHYSNGQEGADVEIQKPDSNTSVGNYKQEVKKEKPEYDELHMNFDELHMISDESDQNGNTARFPHTGDKVYGSIVNTHDLEGLLMPIRFPKTNSFEDFISLQNSIKNDHYKAAVDHLKKALHSTPPAYEALLPLIQASNIIYKKYYFKKTFVVI
ncbi:uncharacterized protein LOC143587751 [Bidens hawaiensis]|uniref:uncharacterized protein LOC143587751 n=1 Tax=Bidens hawaiensis TaxID=980011 RepID=UPI00404B835E